MDSIRSALVNTGNPPPAGLEFNTHPQPLLGDNGGYSGMVPFGDSSVQPHPMMAAPNFNQVPLHPQYMQPVYMNSQPGASIYGQYLPYQVPANVPRPATVSHPAAPTMVYNPPVMLPGPQFLRPYGVMNPGMAYSFAAAPPTSTAPPKDTSRICKKSKGWQKVASQQDSDQPYVKKPRNAYICFVDEQRQNVAAELKITNNSVVNAVLGQRWRNMTDEEQVKYYKQAEAERQLHAQQHPNWSCKENYGKKRRRNCIASTMVTVSTAGPSEEDRPQHDSACLSSLQTCTVEGERGLLQTEPLASDDLDSQCASDIVPTPSLLELPNTSTALVDTTVTLPQMPESIVSHTVEKELQNIVGILDLP